MKPRIRTVLGSLTAAALASAPMPATAAGTLTQVTGFGSNPGNVLMYEYVPANLTAGRPLVVLIHGCSQSTADMDAETGWTKWADQMGFALLFPQQQSANNSSKCWNFFVKSDYQRGGGEPLSIKQGIDWAIAHHASDTRRVFVTGLSSGAAMTNVMLAVYPEVFAAGAPVAGVPFKCATTVGSSLMCNAGTVGKTPAQWGDLVRGATTWRGPWPRVSIWHGTNDLTVNVANLAETMEQWTNVHGTDQTADTSDTVSGYPHKVYRNGAGAAVVETFSITGMGHGQPVDPGTGTTQCGSATGYNLDAGICASYNIARWFGL
ncbi:extracellular catalytic domain type 1 short-chain-length polyhydroxyalkanoate depolymerase [Tsuneonella amylolytica]|uniref:extracellular catalytic domain type 1 short-chain-length polyhydroxyalkanoate depolymerase n=1 Tax=Tsuneonella amylolytica TaxID=2338327 RepID=UPI0018F89456|nr:PHB depolymerase family esterase [Tsuneonella amylolytica]